MAKLDIQTRSFVHVDGELVNTEELDEAQRRRLAVWLKTTYLNALFQGRATFSEGGGNSVK